MPWVTDGDQRLPEGLLCPPNPRLTNIFFIVFRVLSLSFQLFLKKLNFLGPVLISNCRQSFAYEKVHILKELGGAARIHLPSNYQFSPTATPYYRSILHHTPPAHISRGRPIHNLNLVPCPHTRHLSLNHLESTGILPYRTGPFLLPTSRISISHYLVRHPSSQTVLTSSYYI